MGEGEGGGLWGEGGGVFESKVLYMYFCVFFLVGFGLQVSFVQRALTTVEAHCTYTVLSPGKSRIKASLFVWLVIKDLTQLQHYQDSLGVKS